MSVEKEKIVNQLECWVEKNSQPDGWEWFVETRTSLVEAGKPSKRQVFMAMGQIFRRLGKADLELDSGDFETANQLRSGWNPVGWTVDQTARLALLLQTTPDQDFGETLETLCRSADISELLAYYRGLPLFPNQTAYQFRATEGLRSNIKSVFESVAHHNPYPMEQFDENAWNQMVLKAIFIGSQLHPIIGFDKRANVNLARMLCHYAHERWAASRTISPELWRAVGPFAQEVEGGLDDLMKVISAGTDNEKKAAALALSSCPDPMAQKIVASAMENSPGIQLNSLTWDSLTQT